METLGTPTGGAGHGHTARPAMLFDLDGTLLDSVYQHVLAGREALEQLGIELSIWRIHRRDHPGQRTACDRSS